MDNFQFWLENLRAHRTLRELKQSEFFRRHGSGIEAYLQTPQIFRAAKAVPRLRSFLRVVQWNIEKGKRFQEILFQLQSDDILKWADIVILNEADFGMIRSETRHIARDLAQRLEMHAAFGPAHFELTKGTDDELAMEGENRESLQGNAVLSRLPIAEACIVPLPVTFEPYHFHEKRYGSRSCLWTRLQWNGFSVWVGAVHLELRNTPRCRARQVDHLMRRLPGSGNGAYILGGDLNTNSFARGSKLRTVRSLLRLLVSSPDPLKGGLLHPEAGNEPLFRIAHRSGFTWDGINASEETARVSLDSLEESGHLPAPILRLVKERLNPYQGSLCFKLDWLLGKGIRPLRDRQRMDSRTGIGSLNAGVVQAAHTGPDRISDHLPIYADFDLA